MGTQSRELFIKVLVDTIADDVRTELLSQALVQPSASPSTGSMHSEPDMVARLIDWKSRSGSREKRFTYLASEPRKSTPPVHSNASRLSEAAYETRAPEAIFALALLEKLGAKFTANERTNWTISAAALERERLHLILRLHPDRAQNEKDKSTFSINFVAGTEAIATLRSQPTLTESFYT